MRIFSCQVISWYCSSFRQIGQIGRWRQRKIQWQSSTQRLLQLFLDSRCFVFPLRFRIVWNHSARQVRHLKTLWIRGEMDDPWADPAKAASQTGFVVLWCSLGVGSGLSETPLNHIFLWQKEQLDTTQLEHLLNQLGMNLESVQVTVSGTEW